jgi:hypothetical protein
MKYKYEQVSHFLELEQIDRKLEELDTIKLESSGDFLQKVRGLEKLFEKYIGLSTFISKYIIGIISFLWQKAKLFRGSQYDAVLSQKISDYLKTPVNVYVYSENNITQLPQTYGNNIWFVGSALVKNFTIEELGMAIVYSNTVDSVSRNEISIFTQFIGEFFATILLTKLLDLLKKQLNYSGDIAIFQPIPNHPTVTDPATNATITVGAQVTRQGNDLQVLNLLVSAIQGLIVDLMISTASGTIIRKLIERKLVKVVKSRGMEKAYISLYKKSRMYKVNVVETKFGKFVKNFEKMTSDAPDETKMLKDIVNDPEKVEIILKAVKKIV